MDIKVGKEYLCKNGIVIEIVKELSNYFVGNNHMLYDKKDGSTDPVIGWSILEEHKVIGD